MPEKQYLCIDQKSFYESVEYVVRGLDSVPINLVVAHPERLENSSSYLLTKQIAKSRSIIEELKARDQMAWVGVMNDIRNATDKIVHRELIYA